jgi:murein DD-endopeptidase MepM/ murein hydrolase activator NlpD
MPRRVARTIARTAGFCAALLAGGCRPAPDVLSPSRPRADIVLPLETRTIEAIVPRAATLDTLLRQHELPATLVQAAIESTRTVFDPRLIHAGRSYRIVLTVDGLLRELEYQIDTDKYLRIVSRDGSAPEKLDAEVLPYAKERKVVAVRGQIDRERPSLIAAMEATGERVQLAIAMAELFGGQLDFENDLQPGDAFELLFETSTYRGAFAGYGPILAARFVNEGKAHQAYRWVNPETGKPGYYDEEGRSLRRFVLASPLRFTPRVTSGFSRRRMHPVDRTVRAHLGVDYAAPTGTPVVAVANGVVVSAGWAGGGGRQVRIRHGGGFESYYLHLSAFAKGIAAGARVDQGQLIGRVGSTGSATGPHLDYRLRKNGVFVDPRREHAKQPPGEPIPATYLDVFSTARDDMLQQFTTTLASADAPAPPVAPDVPIEKQ